MTLFELIFDSLPKETFVDIIRILITSSLEPRPRAVQIICDTFWADFWLPTYRDKTLHVTLSGFRFTRLEIYSNLSKHDTFCYYPTSPMWLVYPFSSIPLSRFFNYFGSITPSDGLQNHFTYILKGILYCYDHCGLHRCIRPKLGRIHSNSFEFRFFEFWISNSTRFECRIWEMQLNSTRLGCRMWKIEFKFEPKGVLKHYLLVLSRP